MLEIIAKTGLFFSKTIVLASIILVGLLTPYRKIFARVLILVLFTMIYNLYLKSLWKIPLPPPLEGWAFPSGHMHAAVVFWGWLAIEFQKFWFSAVVCFILCLTGYGLVYQGYHYPMDIIGSIGFGSLSLVIYSLLQRISLFKNKPYLLGILLAVLGAILMLLISGKNMKPHVWQAWSVLVFFSLGWLTLNKSHFTLPWLSHSK